MKNLSTGTGLALLSAAILGSTIIMRFGPADQAAHAAPPMEVAKAIAAASTAQVTPTIVWYGTDTVTRTLNYTTSALSVVFRAWSDGRVEALGVDLDDPGIARPTEAEGRMAARVAMGVALGGIACPHVAALLSRVDLGGLALVDEALPVGRVR